MQLKGLNGIRAIAALAVVFTHITSSLDLFGFNRYIFGSYADGNPKATLLASYGVTMFFVLSGFLITYLLLKEKETQNINIKYFYYRRMLRIWPLYYLYLAITVLTLSYFNYAYNGYALLFYFFLAANVPYIIGNGIPYLGHYWSLGVEEQFYLLWPWFVKKTGLLKISLWLLVLLIMLKFAFRIIELKLQVSLPYIAISVTRFHCMLIGCIGAILYYNENKIFISIATNVITQSIAWLIIFLTAINSFHIFSIIDGEIFSLATLAIIISQITKKNRLINLEFKTLDFIGQISYGLYVIHPLVIFYLAKSGVLQNLKTESIIINIIIIYISCITISTMIAYLSYMLFEKRFLGLKDRFTIIRNNTLTKPH